MTRGESGRENRLTSRSVRSPGTKMPETAPNEFCISGGEIPPAIGASTTTDVAISWILPTLRLKGSKDSRTPRRIEHRHKSWRHFKTAGHAKSRQRATRHG